MRSYADAAATQAQHQQTGAPGILWSDANAK